MKVLHDISSLKTKLLLSIALFFALILVSSSSSAILVPIGFEFRNRGDITTVAGTGVRGFLGDGGLATRTQLDEPWDIALDNAGNLYIAERANNRVRKVDSSGIMTTIAGTGTPGYNGDRRPAIEAQLNRPNGVAFGRGDLFIADAGNNRLRQIFLGSASPPSIVSGTIIDSSTGEPVIGATVSTTTDDFYATTSSATTDSNGIYTISDVIGSTYTVAASANGYGSAQQFVFLLGPGESRIVSLSLPRAFISTVAGTGELGSGGSGGPAIQAQLNGPSAVATDSGGNLYIAEQNNHRVQKVDTSGLITTSDGINLSKFL